VSATVAPRRGLVGQSVKRVEDPRLLTGRGCYVDDVDLPGMLHMAIVRSQLAHARVLAIGTERAEAIPGVHLVMTAAGLETTGARDLAVTWIQPGQKSVAHPLLVRDKVRFVGEALAIVVAEDRYIAEDAADLIDVEYEDLPSVVDAVAALEPGAPLLHDDWGDNLIVELRSENGDAERAFREAEVVVRKRLKSHRYMACPLETRGVVASVDALTGELTIWISVQAPHRVRTHLAATLGWPEHRLRVIAPDVGGGFGLKDDAYVDEVLAAVASIATGRPVKWIEDRREHFLASMHAREQLHEVELAATRDGRITAMRDRIVADNGAYCATIGVGPLATTLIALPGPYRFQDYSVQGLAVATNKVPSGGYRGFGITQAAFVTERMVDILARELDLDPAEVRRRNFIQPDEFPFRSASGLVYDSGDYPHALERALELLGYDEWRGRQAEWAATGRYVGIGICSYVELTGLAPSKTMAASGMAIGGYENVVVRMDPQGRATVLTGLSSTGQSHRTTLAQICATELAIPLEDVAVVQGDTAQTPYAPAGSIGSRGAAVGGAAVLLASRRLREKIVHVAAHLLEANPSDLDLDEGLIFVRGNRGSGIPVRAAAAAALLGHDLPDGMKPGLEEHELYDPIDIAYSYATHAAVIEVDVATGLLQFHRYVVVHDCGTVINPAVVDGQVVGGTAQGIGGAVLEELVYGDDGQLLTTSFMDYLLPSSSDVPPIVLDHTETPSPHVPGGMKGVGEGGAIGPPAAVANAVEDALRPFGVEVTETPLSPGRVWALIAAARQRAEERPEH
jgi:carbon-monoxide dehydrogenase large subunit